jgi:hypothetical protein
MLLNEDLPRADEIPDGWFVVRMGLSWSGDKFWRPVDRIWLPITGSDPKNGWPVWKTDMPVVIRKGWNL